MGIVKFEGRANGRKESSIQFENVGIDDGVVDFFIADRIKQVFDAGVDVALPSSVRGDLLKQGLVAGTGDDRQAPLAEIVQAGGRAEPRR
jgi:hypothetical protein